MLLANFLLVYPKELTLIPSAESRYVEFLLCVGQDRDFVWVVLRDEAAAWASLPRNAFFYFSLLVRVTRSKFLLAFVLVVELNMEVMGFFAPSS